MLAQPGVKPTRKLKHESRAPGICGALLGFLFLFMGIMMLAIMKDVTKDEADKAIVIAGPIFLALGLIFITAGFIHQYWVHKKWKAREYEKNNARKAKAKKYATSENGDIHQTTDGIVLGVNGFDHDINMKVDMNGFAITEENQNEIFQHEYYEQSDYAMSHAIIGNDRLSTVPEEPQAGTSREDDCSHAGPSCSTETGDEIVPIPDTATAEYLRASQHFYCVDDDEDDSWDEEDLQERYSATRAAENYGFEYEFGEEVCYEEYSGPSLEYEPPKSYTDPEIFCVSNLKLEMPSQEELKDGSSSGKTPRYSRYTSSKFKLKHKLPSIKLPNLSYISSIIKSPRGSNPTSPRVTSPTGSEASMGSYGIEATRSPSPRPNAITVADTQNEPVANQTKSKSNFRLPQTLTSKAKSLRAGLRGEKLPWRRNSHPDLQKSQTGTGNADSRPRNAASTSSFRPSSAESKPYESVIMAEIHVSSSCQSEDKDRPNSACSSTSESRTPRSISTTSLQESQEMKELHVHMPDAST